MSSVVFVAVFDACDSLSLGRAAPIRILAHAVVRHFSYFFHILYFRDIFWYFLNFAKKPIKIDIKITIDSDIIGRPLPISPRAHIGRLFYTDSAARFGHFDHDDNGRRTHRRILSQWAPGHDVFFRGAVRTTPSPSSMVDRDHRNEGGIGQMVLPPHVVER